MKVFLAGASGVIGIRLIPLLTEAGHQVTAMTRTPAKIESLRMLGADAVVSDVFDEVAVRDAVTEANADVVMSQITDLPDDVKGIAGFGVANSRIRREGTRNLLSAARAAGVARFIAQSVAWKIPGDGGAAVADLEHMVLDAGGVIIRYGQFYGPGTYHDRPPPSGPYIHIDDAARRTLEALTTTASILTVTEN
jgi:nucleoside-diphosphate-sugar epimerase